MRGGGWQDLAGEAGRSTKMVVRFSKANEQSRSARLLSVHGDTRRRSRWCSQEQPERREKCVERERTV
ncbi:hypothetical protein M6B38_266470 [Iris pallida]|uniref:Uncharacterized protein n=1 Tax=Iris pallida TaxID=29817 RepID=A0AAX6I9Z3_IRIPA|nr:hypothetical protein M6B38_266470 [Iris pallida]